MGQANEKGRRQHADQDSQNRTARTGRTGEDCNRERTASTGLPIQDRMDRTAKTDGQDMTSGTEQME
jgi:hypothetical protein